MKTIKEVQQSLNNNKDIVQCDKYLIVHPGLTEFKFEQVITHKQLLEFLQKNPINTIEILPHIG